MAAKYKLGQENVPLAIEYLGEHLEHYVLDDVCERVGGWLSERKYPSEIEKMLGGESDLEESGLVTRRGESDEKYWSEVIENLYDLGDLYKTSFKEWATRALWIDDNAYTHVMAVRGNPSIEQVVEHYHKNADFHGVFMGGEESWHDDLKKEGVVIHSVCFFAGQTDVSTKTHMYEHRLNEDGKTWTVEKTPIVKD